MEKAAVMDLSIVIPVYNTPQKYLEECLKSIDDSKIGYSYELIFINDGSTDENILQFLHQIDLKNAKIECILRNTNSKSSFVPGEIITFEYDKQSPVCNMR